MSYLPLEISESGRAITRWLGAALIAAATVMLPVGASAQSRVSAADKYAARQLVAKGDKQFAEGQYQEALESYRGAHVIMGVPTTGFEVARTQVALGKLLEARKTLQEVIDYRQRRRNLAFEKARRKAKELLEDLAKRIPTLSVRVTGAPPQAEVTVAIDGATLTDPNEALPVNPGSHRVLASAPGFEDTVRMVDVGDRDRTTVELVLKRPPPPADASSDAWPVAYTGFAIAGAGVIVGSIMGGLSLARASELTDRCPEKTNCPPDVMPLQEESITFAHVSTGSFAVAGAGAAMGVIALVVALTDGDAEDTEQEPEEATDSLSLTPLIGPGQLGLRGTF